MLPNQLIVCKVSWISAATGRGVTHFRARRLHEARVRYPPVDSSSSHRPTCQTSSSAVTNQRAARQSLRSEVVVKCLRLCFCRCSYRQEQARYCTSTPRSAKAL